MGTYSITGLCKHSSFKARRNLWGNLSKFPHMQSSYQLQEFDAVNNRNMWKFLHSLQTQNIIIIQL